MQTLVRGEARSIEVSAMLQSDPAGRTFFARLGKRGQVARVEVELEPDDAQTEELDDGRFRVVLIGTLPTIETAKLSKGPTDVSIRATSPVVRLNLGTVDVDDDMGVGGIL